MEIRVQHDGHTYTMVLGPLGNGRRTVQIARDGVWSGDGIVRYLGEDGDEGAVIDECAAVLGEDVYEALEEALNAAEE